MMARKTCLHLLFSSNDQKRQPVFMGRGGYRTVTTSLNLFIFHLYDKIFRNIDLGHT